jgi:hypothetical protein
MTINTTDLTLFQRENTPGGGVYTTIPQVIRVKPPERTRKKVEVYTMDQSAPNVKYGAEEALTCEVELAFDNDASAHQQFYSDYVAKTVRNYKIIYPNTGAREDVFSATIEGIVPGEQTAEGTEAQTVTVTLGLSAAPTTTW